MRTTLDLPDDLFRRLEARAALEGLKLKELIARYVAWGLKLPSVPESPDSDEEPFVSAYDLMQDGCGIVSSGVGDLSTNPEHMEDFGRV